MTVEREPVRDVFEEKPIRGRLSPERGAGRPATSTAVEAWLVRSMRRLDAHLRRWIAQTEAWDVREGRSDSFDRAPRQFPAYRLTLMTVAAVKIPRS